LIPLWTEIRPSMEISRDGQLQRTSSCGLHLPTTHGPVPRLRRAKCRESVFVVQVRSRRSRYRTWGALSGEVAGCGPPCCCGRAKAFARAQLAAERQRLVIDIGSRWPELGRPSNRPSCGADFPIRDVFGNPSPEDAVAGIQWVFARSRRNGQEQGFARGRRVPWLELADFPIRRDAVE